MHLLVTFRKVTKKDFTKKKYFTKKLRSKSKKSSSNFRETSIVYQIIKHRVYQCTTKKPINPL
mgnify:CR=1 FL=1